MRILIDECLPVGMKKILKNLGHEREAVRYAGLGSKRTVSCWRSQTEPGMCYSPATET